MAEKFANILDDVCEPLTVKKFSEKARISKKEAVNILEKHVKSTGAPLWSLYEVSGIAKSSDFPFLPENQQILKHIVVPSSELDDVKLKFEKVTSTRLHSVQRTNPKDTRVYGRSWANNDDLSGKDLPKQEGQKKKIEEVQVKTEKTETTEPSTSKNPPQKEEKVEKKINPPKKQMSVKSLFAKKKEKSPTPPPVTEKTRKRPKVEVDEVAEDVVEKKKSPKKRTVFEANEDDEHLPSSREQTPEKEKSSSPPPKKSRVNNENRKKKEKPKRKLIVPDSDEEEDDVKKEDVPMEVDEKQENQTEDSDRRRTTRIEKIVETYVDEDGYLVSKEVQKAVECSPIKEKPKSAPKVITAPIPGTAKTAKKNSTITSFFKKC